MSSDPDRPIHIKVMVSITSVFVVLAALVAFYLESREGIGPAGEELEQQWASFARDNYAAARSRADEALKRAR